MSPSPSRSVNAVPLVRTPSFFMKGNFSMTFAKTPVAVVHVELVADLAVALVEVEVAVVVGVREGRALAPAVVVELRGLRDVGELPVPLVAEELVPADVVREVEVEVAVVVDVRPRGAEAPVRVVEAGLAADLGERAVVVVAVHQVRLAGRVAPAHDVEILVAVAVDVGPGGRPGPPRGADAGLRADLGEPDAAGRAVVVEEAVLHADAVVGHEQVQPAVVVVVGERALVGEVLGVDAGLDGDVDELDAPGGAHVAQQPVGLDLALPALGDEQVGAAVVVDVGEGRTHREADVAEVVAGRGRDVGEHDVPGGAVVAVELVGAALVRDVQVVIAVAVDVGEGDPLAPPLVVGAGLPGHVRERQGQRRPGNERGQDKVNAQKDKRFGLRHALLLSCQPYYPETPYHRGIPRVNFTIGYTALPVRGLHDTPGRPLDAHGPAPSCARNPATPASAGWRLPSCSTSSRASARRPWSRSANARL